MILLRAICSSFLVMFATALTPFVAEAETLVPSVLEQDTVWVKEGNPYRISSYVTVRPNVTLSIGPGVVVEFSDRAHLQVLQAAISIVGTESEPVVFTGSATSSWALDVIGPLASSTESIVASHARLENASQGLYLQSAAGSMSDIDFVGGEDGLYVSSSTLAISNSRFSGMSNSALSIDQHSTLFVASSSFADLHRSGITAHSGSFLNLRNVRIDRSGRNSAVGIYNSSADIEHVSFVGGHASALEVYGDVQQGESHVSIHHSTLIGFDDPAVYAGKGTVVSAERNWWGSPDGPQDATYGVVSVSPWLLKPPGQGGDSSVLFVPGIQASRLFQGENQLWEPNRNDDVKKLYLDTAGAALVANIQPGSIIDSVNSVGIGPNIYKSFIEQLDGMVVQKQISEWRPLPYDWRFSASVAAEAAVEQVKQMASSSFTGKVSIVAHSNGGLVTRHLLHRLAEMYLDIIDTVVFVATPHSGTPQAIAAVLHGDGLQFAAGLILKQSVGRRLAQYSPGALGLLPAQEYFDTLSAPTGPIIRFSSTTDLVSMNFFQAYGDRLDSATRLNDFLSAAIDHRTPPDVVNVDIPAVVERSLVESASQRFAVQYPPATVLNIVGWGLDTLSGIEYSGSRSCVVPTVSTKIFSLCELRTTLRRTPVWTRLGDKTVVLSSAIARPAALSAAGQTYFANLSAYNNRRFRVSRNHADILEVPSVRELIASILHSPTESDQALSVLPEHITTSSPATTTLPKQIRIAVHSPVTLDLYDELGNHTGLTQPYTPFSEDTATSSPLFSYEEAVLGSQYYHFGETKYLSFVEPLPLAGGRIATTSRVLLLRSTGAGLLTIDVEYLSGDTVIGKTTFSDIPITPLSTISANLVLPINDFDTLANASYVQTSAATSTATTTLRRLVPDQTFDPVAYLSSVRQVIREICMSQRLRLQLLARLNAYIGLFEKGELPIAQAQLEEMVIVSDPSTQHLLDTAESRGSYISAVEAMLSRIANMSGNR